jgi:phosphohistidine phosphatase
MILYLIRHAVAAEAVPHGPRDQDSRRPLTDTGRRKMRQIATGLTKLQASIDLILSSPYLRATQTAGILAKKFELSKDKVILSENLSPAGHVARLVKEINENFGGLDCIAIVGHEPYLTSLASVLISGDPGLPITLKKGGICRLSVASLQHGRCATLDWLLAPSQLVRIGR